MAAERIIVIVTILNHFSLVHTAHSTDKLTTSQENNNREIQQSKGGLVSLSLAQAPQEAGKVLQSWDVTKVAPACDVVHACMVVPV